MGYEMPAMAARAIAFASPVTPATIRRSGSTSRMFFRQKRSRAKLRFDPRHQIPSHNLVIPHCFPIKQKGEGLMPTRKKSSGRKASGGRKYSPLAGRKVKRAMHEEKRGTLKSGRSGKKVTSRKQAIAIGLSEARKAGAKVPKRSAPKRALPAPSPSREDRGRS